MEAQITISGGIIGELSEKIPSNIIALNELIKNSYDAGANKVAVTLDSQSKTLTIVDDGCGMDENSINILFHISQSEKTYGVKNQYGRYTQGSKGLGFLSVFKFGKDVCWITKKEKGLKFCAQYDTLINSDNISSLVIPIEPCPEAQKGTKIVIKLEEYSADSLISYLSDLSNLQKVIYSFEDSSFEITLNVNGTSYSSKDKQPLIQIYPERQLYYVKYSSQEQKIKYYHNGVLILSKDYLFNANEYEIDIEIVIYQLKSRGKNNIIPLFYNPQGDLTPLIYINTNLFNNFNIFDPNIMKNIKTSDVLNQMIGSIRIFSSSSSLSFNSDRSQFLQNPLTDGIKEFLYNINKTIQTLGSQYKKYLLDFDILTTLTLPSNRLNDNSFLRSIIKDQFAFKDKVEIHKIDKKVVYSFAKKECYANIYQVNPNDEASSASSKGQTQEAGATTKGAEGKENSGEDNSVTTAKIILKQFNKKIDVPSGQINLYDEIIGAYDSKGNSISKNSIIVKEENAELQNAILQSVIIPCKKNIYYSYTDSITGLVTVRVEFEFVEPKSPVRSSSQKMPLIYIPAHQGYNISFNVSLGNLINQINMLDVDKYTEVLSCTLRATFELSIDSIKKCSKYSSLTWNKELKENIKLVISYIKSKKSFIGAVATSTKVDFDSLKNILEPSDVDVYVPKLHLGAHKSMQYVTKDEIVKLGKLAGVFVVVANEMINNPNIN
ncbi:hypothetical protein Ami103574_03035 [Aminipila butyrica]|uniref:Uncharacterized protein n=1 Tax=Aminipila butyrica TaxID=433296 RepID=A0A858BTT3_9FIRM|nr:ATP-binding protein [Aminipila butyrica]QIB68350.1 hypothetical protein Ami103574_03035 [Aminipila butyrica]